MIRCSAATVLSNEEANQTVTTTAKDNAGNTATIATTISIDKTAPTLGAPSWSGNPKSTTSEATFTVPVTETLSGLAEAEYFLGDNDPGQGNGATMTIDGNNLNTTFGTDFPTGVWKVSVRAKDKAGNWSEAVSDYLVVYDASGVRMTGQRTLLPSFENGDLLPGLTTSNQDDRAHFGFSVRYDQNGQVHPFSDFQFSYRTGARCFIPSLAQNCHLLYLNATSIEWLATQGTNHSTGLFQGTARLWVDGKTRQVVFRLTGVDGERLDDTSSDHLTLRVFASDENPNTAAPIYQVSTEVNRGNIRIRTR